jgi:hypothetical protein
MKSPWIVGAVLIIAILFGCQAVVTGLPGSDLNSNTNGPAGLTLNVTQPTDESIVRSNPISITGNIKPEADIMVNGLSIEVENGHFSALVELEPGPNIIDVSASDSSGKQASKYLTVVYVP